MDRIINVKVSGHHLSKDNNTAGARGEGNVTKLRITFDDSWYSFTKTITFWDAHGENPVYITLTTDFIENKAENMEVYLVPIPQEPLAIAGTLTFAIDGYMDNKRQKSVYGELVVEDSPITPQKPTDPTPTQAELLQSEIEGIKNTIQDAVIACKNAEDARDDADMHKQDALVAMGEAMRYAEEAENSSNKAHNAVGKTSYIGDNGNWFAWDSVKDAFYDTGVKAQAGSTVYVGENPPANADVWIDPDGVPNVATRAFINLLGGADNWEAEDVEDSNGNVIGSRYGQRVNINNAVITPNSKVDMQISSEQMVIFYEKDLAFVAENEEGVVTIYCIGSVPENNYTIQVTVTEVSIDG